MQTHKPRYHNGYKYIVWKGYTGIWAWQLVDFPANRVIGGQAETQREAGEQARAKIDRCTR